MPTEKTRAFLQKCAFACLLALFFLATKGYQYGKADQAEHLPQVLKMLDGRLFQNDFFLTQNAQTFSIRQYFVWLVYGFSLVFGIKTACFLGCFGSIFALVLGLMYLMQQFTQTKIAPYFFAILVVFVFYNFTIGGNNITYPMFICSSLAKAFVPFALAYFIQKKYAYAFLLLGIASWFQVLVGLQVAVILVAILVTTGFYGKALRFFGFFVVVASPILVPIIYVQFVATQHFSAAQNAEFIAILTHFRNANHYLPSAYPLMQYLKFGGLLGLFCVVNVCLAQKKLGVERRFIWSFMGISLLGMLVYFLGFERLNIAFLAKTQWFKTSLWVAMLCCVPLAELLAHFWGKRRFFSDKVLWSLLILGNFLVGFWLQKQVFKPATALEKIHFWIADHTPLQAQILSLPTDHSFACEAKRSQPVSWQAVIHEPFFMLLWKKRIDSLYFGGKTANNKQELSLDNLDLIALKKYKITHILAQKPFEKSGVLGKIIHEEPPYILIQVNR